MLHRSYSHNYESLEPQGSECLQIIMTLKIREKTNMEEKTSPVLEYSPLK